MAVPKRKINVTRFYKIKAFQFYKRCPLCKSKTLLKGVSVCFPCLKV